MGCSGPPALQRQNKIISFLDSDGFCPWGSPGLSFQTVGEEVFSADLVADAPPLSPHPLCVFQSAEFFEMLEKMQVSIPKVGKLSLGWGCCSDLGEHDPRQNPQTEFGGLGGRGREEKTHSPDSPANLRPFPF